MANALYDAGRDAFANGNIDWVNDDIRLLLIDTDDYTVDLAVHDNLDDVAAGSRVATQALAGQSTSAGICDATDTTFSSVSGDESEALIIYLHTGTESTSTLIAYIDTATGFPITPSGGDIIVQWANTTNKIFKL